MWVKCGNCLDRSRTHVVGVQYALPHPHLYPCRFADAFRYGGRREVKQVVNPAATRHAKTTGGRREVTQVVKPAASRDPTTRGSDERDELIGHLALRFTSRLEHAIARWYLQYQNGPINGHVLLLMSVEDVISFYRCPIVARESSQEWPTSTLRCPPVQRGRTVVLSGRLAVFRVPGCCDEAAPQ